MARSAARWIFNPMTSQTWDMCSKDHLEVIAVRKSLSRLEDPERVHGGCERLACKLGYEDSCRGITWNALTSNGRR